MTQTNKILPLLTAFIWLGVAAPNPALARDSAEIAKIFDSGVAAYDGGNYEQAFKIWWDLRYEDLAAMRNLAMMLRKGQGVAKDPKEAEELFQRAAEAGLPTAQASVCMDAVKTWLVRMSSVVHVVPPSFEPSKCQLAGFRAG